MANGFRYPAPTGAAVSGFTEALLNGIALRRKLEQDAQEKQLRDLQIGAAQRAETEQQAYPQDLASILAARRATPSPMVSPDNVVTLAPSEFSSTPIGPSGQPSIAAAAPSSVTTLPDLSSQVSPEILARTLKRPGGADLLKNVGVVTPEESAHRQRAEKGRTEANRLIGESVEHYGKGEVIQGLLKEANALRALADTADNPAERARILEQAGKNTAAAATLVKNEEQRKKFSEESQKLTGAYTAFQKTPTLETFGDLLNVNSGLQSDEGVKIRDKFFEKIREGSFKKIDDLPITQANIQLGQILEENLKTGKRLTPEQAYTELFTQNPTAITAYLDYASQHKGDLPKAVRTVIFGEETPKNEIELAIAQAKAEGLTGAQLYHRAKELTIQMKDRSGELKTRQQDEKERQARVRELQNQRGQNLREKATLLKANANILIDPEEKAQNTQQLQALTEEIASIDQELVSTGAKPAIAEKPTKTMDDTKRRLEELLTQTEQTLKKPRKKFTLDERRLILRQLGTEGYPMTGPLGSAVPVQ